MYCPAARSRPKSEATSPTTANDSERRNMLQDNNGVLCIQYRKRGLTAGYLYRCSCCCCCCCGKCVCFRVQTRSAVAVVSTGRVSLKSKWGMDVEINRFLQHQGGYYSSYAVLNLEDQVNPTTVYPRYCKTLESYLRSISAALCGKWRIKLRWEIYNSHSTLFHVPWRCV